MESIAFLVSSLASSYLTRKGVSVTSESITQSTGYPLCEACPEKSVEMGTDCLGMRIAVDWDIKP